MDRWMIEKGIEVLPAFSAMLMFLAVFFGGISGLLGAKKLRKGYRRAIERIAEKSREKPWYDRTQQWLKKNGASYHFGEWIGPLRFLLLRLGLGLSGLWAVSHVSVGYGVLAGAGLYCLPALLVPYLNKKDNLRMLPELKHLYHSLEIQTHAGVYVTDALAEVYGSVQEKRLKQALLDLAGDIVMRADLGEALERLQGKFDNSYIDSLCIIILQAMESGQSVDLLSDLSEQIKDMESAVMMRKKESLDRSVTFYQLGILVAIMGIVLYACVTQMFTAATRF